LKERSEPTPSQAGRPEQQTPQQRGEVISGVPPPEQKIVYTQEHYDRDQQEKSELRKQFVAFISPSGHEEEDWKSLSHNRLLFKRIREIERRQKRYLREQEKKEREQRRLARLELTALREAGAAERRQRQPKAVQIYRMVEVRSKPR
jgi:hypothetical protein